MVPSSCCCSLWTMPRAKLSSALFCEYENTRRLLPAHARILIETLWDTHRPVHRSPLCLQARARVAELPSAPTQFSRAMDELGDTDDLRPVSSGQGPCGESGWNLPGQDLVTELRTRGRDHHQRGQGRCSGSLRLTASTSASEYPRNEPEVAYRPVDIQTACREWVAVLQAQS